MGAPGSVWPLRCSGGGTVALFPEPLCSPCVWLSCHLSGPHSAVDRPAIRGPSLTGRTPSRRPHPERSPCCFSLEIAGSCPGSLCNTAVTCPILCRLTFEQLMKSLSSLPVAWGKGRSDTSLHSLAIKLSCRSPLAVQWSVQGTLPPSRALTFNRHVCGFITTWPAPPPRKIQSYSSARACSYVVVGNWPGLFFFLISTFLI